MLYNQSYISPTVPSVVQPVLSPIVPYVVQSEHSEKWSINAFTYFVIATYIIILN